MIRNIKSFLLAAVAVLTVNEAVAQQESLNVLRSVPLSGHYNPAFGAEQKVYFYAPVLPNISFSSSIYGFKLSDAFVKHPGSDSLYFNYNSFYNKLHSDVAIIDANLKYDILGGGWTLMDGKYNFRIGVSNITEATVHLPKGLFKIFEGNYDFESGRLKEMSIDGTYFMMQNYIEFLVGFNRLIELGDIKLRVGLNAKYLNGFANVQTNNMRFTIDTQRNSDGMGYNVRVSNKGIVETSLPMDVEEDRDGYVDLGETEFGTSVFDNIGFGNPGFGVDLGATLDLLEDKLHLALSLRDLGFISWRKNNCSFEADNNFVYDGFDFTDRVKAEKYDELDRTMEHLADTISNLKNIRYSENEGYKTTLVPKLLVQGSYNLMSWLQLGVMFDARFEKNRVFRSSELISVLLQPNHHFGFVTLLGLHSGKNTSLGFGLQATGGPFQFYMSTDRVPFFVRNFSGINFQLGVVWRIKPARKDGNVG